MSNEITIIDDDYRTTCKVLNLLKNTSFDTLCHHSIYNSDVSIEDFKWNLSHLTNLDDLEVTLKYLDKVYDKDEFALPDEQYDVLFAYVEQLKAGKDKTQAMKTYRVRQGSKTIIKQYIDVRRVYSTYYSSKGEENELTLLLKFESDMFAPKFDGACTYLYQADENSPVEVYQRNKTLTAQVPSSAILPHVDLKHGERKRFEAVYAYDSFEQAQSGGPSRSKIIPAIANHQLENLWFIPTENFDDFHKAFEVINIRIVDASGRPVNQKVFIEVKVKGAGENSPSKVICIDGMVVRPDPEELNTTTYRKFK